MLSKNVLFTLSVFVPLVELEPLVHVFDGSSGEQHTEDLGTSAAIEVVQSVVRHGEGQLGCGSDKKELFSRCCPWDSESRLYREQLKIAGFYKQRWVTDLVSCQTWKPVSWFELQRRSFCVVVQNDLFIIRWTSRIHTKQRLFAELLDSIQKLLKVFSRHCSWKERNTGWANFPITFVSFDKANCRQDTGI